MKFTWKALILILAVLAALFFSATRSGAQMDARGRLDTIARGEVSYGVERQGRVLSSARW
jgi:hypothetical protein